MTTSTTQPGGNVTGAGGSTTIDIGNGTANGTREPICEIVDGKEVCTCVNLASIGMVAHYGATNGGTNTDSTDAFMAWLPPRQGGQLSWCREEDRKAVVEDLGRVHLAQLAVCHDTDFGDLGKDRAWFEQAVRRPGDPGSGSS